MPDRVNASCFYGYLGYRDECAIETLGGSGPYVRVRDDSGP